MSRNRIRFVVFSRPEEAAKQVWNVSASRKCNRAHFLSPRECLSSTRLIVPSSLSVQSNGQSLIPDPFIYIYHDQYGIFEILIALAQHLYISYVTELSEPLLSIFITRMSHFSFCNRMFNHAYLRDIIKDVIEILYLQLVDEIIRRI